ncbi:MAG TPA: MucR family transcriptional regulator [Candidatus Desulfovibrio intestinipullorum]|uniref:MucR family transcriptional regulator n=1 Tax=Candidatus Desulfovibrio intestinipullorum TaxID=2838536 RepID=A0A9D1PVL0_9BACT|nr:MucR family transcriptional regulator [Candidatus Desulfovibrio intestinipullorum]
MPNQEIIQQALEIARAQAGVRPMTAAEVATYVAEVAQALESTMDSECGTATPAVDPKRSIGEAYVTCLECGKKFKVMTIRHLKTHGLTAKEYKAKWGLKKEVSLAAKGLVRMRRKKMQEMRLWERRGLKGE